MAGEARDAMPATRGRMWLRRTGWLIVYWLLGVAAVGAIAYGLRLIMGWAGLSR
jgi:hypothetical protein